MCRLTYYLAGYSLDGFYYRLSFQQSLMSLKKEIFNCKVCEQAMGHPVKPVCAFTSSSKIVIIGQAPGVRVHESGIPWHDKSGDNLRSWMGIDDGTFYDEQQVAIVPMGFCYPGKGKSGDLPPRKECAPLWHDLILDKLKNVKLTLLIGKYAQDYYLQDNTKKNLTETVRSFQDYLPQYMVMPHPSPRNNIWMKKNDWFKRDLLPILKDEVQAALR